MAGNALRGAPKAGTPYPANAFCKELVCQKGQRDGRQRFEGGAQDRYPVSRECFLRYYVGARMSAG